MAPNVIEPLSPDDAAGTQAARPRGTGMPTSSPSTWTGIYVIGAVAVLTFLRHSLRRFT